MDMDMNLNKRKKIILCADDYGMSEKVNSGILELARQKRISAISCMVNMPDFDPKPLKKQEIRNQASIGLHFNLTDGSEAVSLNQIICRTFLNKKNKKYYENKLLNQISLFQEKMGFLPEFIDGHQHIHSFNKINSALINVIEQKYSKNPKNLWIRSITVSPLEKYARIKSSILYALSYLSNKKIQNVTTNSSFFGLNSLEKTTTQKEMFKYWMHKSKE